MNNGKPLILLFLQSDVSEENKSATIYIRAIEKAGGEPYVLYHGKDGAEIKSALEKCDGFFFTGGADVSPKRYGEAVKESCGPLDEARDAFEFSAFDFAIKTDKPILGICRGMQLINAAMGGTLHQDIPSEIRTDILHRQTAPTFDPWHRVEILRDTPLFNLAGKSGMSANSFHHQCVKTLAPSLREMAKAPDGITEAFYLEGERYLRAYQWHPERLTDSDEDNSLIFSDFIKACKACASG